MKKLFCLFLFFTLSMVVFSQQQNFDFEVVNDTLPANWRYYKTQNYKVSLEKDIVYQGKHAISIASVDNYKDLGYGEYFQAVAHLAIPYTFKGKKIKITGYIKTENISDEGWGGFYLDVKPGIGFINMRGENITGTTEWTQYEMETILNDDAYLIVVGVLLAGEGKLWADDIKIYVDDVLMDQMPKWDFHKNKDWKYYHYRAFNNYNNILNGWKRRDSIDSTFVYIDKAISITRAEGMKLRAAMLYQLRSKYAAIKDSMSDSKVIEGAYKALEVASQLNEKEHKLPYLVDIATLHTFSGNEEKAIELLEQTALHLRKIKSQGADRYYTFIKEKEISLVSVYHQLASNYLELQNTEKVRKYNQLSLNELYDPDLGSYYKNQFYVKQHFEKEFYVMEGKLYMLNGEYEKAEQSFLTAFKELPKENDNTWIYKAQKKYHLSKIAFQQKKYEKVVQLLEEGKPKDPIFFANFIDYDDYYLMLAKSYSKLEKEEEASRYLQSYIDIAEKNRKNKSQLTKKVQQKEIVQVQEELKELASSQRLTEIQLLLGGALLVILLLFGGQHIYASNKRNQKRFKAVLHKLEQKEYELVVQNAQKNTPIRAVQPLKDKLINDLKKGLERIEKTAYFLNKECTQVTVAKKLKTNTAYLSKFMNSHYGFGFNTYLNNLRIHYAIQRLKNDKIFRSYTVQAISEELGYRSSNTFTKAFKKETGLLPSYYIKELTLFDEKSNEKIA